MIGQWKEKVELKVLEREGEKAATIFQKNWPRSDSVPIMRQDPGKPQAHKDSMS